MSIPDDRGLFPTFSKNVSPWASMAAIAALLLVIGYAAVPRFGRGGRQNANESAAIATLKNIASAQEQIARRAVIDCDGDGRGEFASFAELAGAGPLRAARGAAAGERLDPPVLSESFGEVRDGAVARSGYLFEMFLPGSGGAWLREASRGGAATGVSAERAAHEWLCYARPMVAGSSGSRVFVMDARGNLLATAARPEERAGLGPPVQSQPVPGRTAHVLRGGVWSLAANTVDAFGSRWQRVR